jgi:4-amino-4-deoxy-L-arabinose transferase-like glycosyltransferase
VPRRYSSALLFFLAFLALLIAIHLPYLKLPYFWDEMGQFAPAALDLYHDGAWVSHSTPPNVHPPGVMAFVALVWRVFGYSIQSARLAMLVVASLGVLFSFLLTIRLARGTVGAPAFAAVLFLMVTPIFYTQSMLVMLDMPAMTFTILALLLFLEERYVACAVVCTVLVLVKETAITTPAVFAVWLWFREKRRAEALYFSAPAMALGLWLLVLHRATGHWLGNAEFASQNIGGALDPFHIAAAFGLRAWFLFVGDGRWIGAVTLFVGWRLLRGKEWTIAALVAVAQVVMVTVLGYAELERYLLPVLPILYAGVATAASAYPASWRWTSNTAMIGLLIVGLFWNPPYPYPYEDNLAMVDFVRLQEEAASFLEANAPAQRIASVWPFTVAIQNPELGYVEHPLSWVEAPGLHLADLAALDRRKYDVLVVYRRFPAVEGTWLDIAPLRRFLSPNYHPQATEEEIRAGLGFVPLKRWTRRDQWIEIYVPGE